MIGRIRGELIEKQPPFVLIEAFGVGYEILTPRTSVYHLGKPGEQVVLYTHFVVRKDAQELYGFITKSDRRLFQALININGIGAKMGLEILSGIDSATFVHCMKSQDHGLLCSIPGIGKKTAERIVMELKDKIDKISYEMDELSKKNVFEDNVNVISPENSGFAAKNIINEAINALETLGYKKKDAEKSVKKVQSQATTLEEMIKLSLKTAQT